MIALSNGNFKIGIRRLTNHLHKAIAYQTLEVNESKNVTVDLLLKRLKLDIAHRQCMIACHDEI